MDWAVVFDADTLAGSPEFGLDKWIVGQKADIAHYERCTTYEITAGNYLARNTPAAIQYLREWAAFEFKRPSGYSSADNGALHLHILQALNWAGADECGRLYSGLQDHGQNMDAYFKFTVCARSRLGMGKPQPPTNKKLMDFRNTKFIKDPTDYRI